jgi:hypothetical protein
MRKLTLIIIAALALVAATAQAEDADEHGLYGDCLGQVVIRISETAVKLRDGAITSHEAASQIVTEADDAGHCGSYAKGIMDQKIFDDWKQKAVALGVCKPLIAQTSQEGANPIRDYRQLCSAGGI